MGLLVIGSIEWPATLLACENRRGVVKCFDVTVAIRSIGKSFSANAANQRALPWLGATSN
jgi:hypothetical protein